VSEHIRYDYRSDTKGTSSSSGSYLDTDSGSDDDDALLLLSSCNS